MPASATIARVVVLATPSRAITAIAASTSSARRSSADIRVMVPPTLSYDEARPVSAPSALQGVRPGLPTRTKPHFGPEGWRSAVFEVVLPFVPHRIAALPSSDSLRRPICNDNRLLVKCPTRRLKTYVVVN